MLILHKLDASKKQTAASIKFMTKDFIDRDRTRTCNPQIRSLMPYPLGHTAMFTCIQN